MNLRDVQYLVAVSELKHFGRAAEACHVSQPTLSMQLKKLEQTLGAALFERSNRRVLLTPAGEAVIQHARHVLDAARQMQEAAKAAKDPLAAEIALGAFPTLAPYLLPLIVPALKKKFPKLALRLVEEKTDMLLAQLQRGQIDAALLALPIHAPGIETKELFTEPFFLAVHEGHAWAKRKSIKPEQLSGQTLLLLDEGHCLRDQALDVCRTLGMQESQNFRATSLETLRQMVAAGTATTLIPALALSNDNRAIRYVPFTGKPPSRSIALAFRKSSAKRPFLERLGELIAAQAKKKLGR